MRRLLGTERIDTPPLDVGEATAALAYLRRRDALDLAWMLGLEE